MARDSRRRTLRATALGAALIAAVTLAPVVPQSAAEPRTADQLVANYRKLSHSAEETAEAMNQAQTDYETQRKQVLTQRKASVAASRELAEVDVELRDVQERIDALARASYRGARVNRLYAMLVSDSPQNLLDNMSGLEMMSRQVAADRKNAVETARKARDAKNVADKAAQDARVAVAEAERRRGALQAKQSDLQLQAVRIRAIYQSMTGRQLAALRGPKYNFNPNLVPKGTDPHLVAVQAAISRIGDPYVWGAVGPDEFDCSGLMLWAFKQAGRTIPRTSEAQLGGGTAVSRDDLRPGDLIIYYPAATHVGMYVGDGFVVHASTFGVPVAVVPIDKAGPYNQARRY